MLTTDEVCLLADVGRVAHGVKASVDNVRDICLRGDVHAGGPERDFALGELERVAGQLSAVSDLMQALYYAAPPCHLGDMDARAHERVAAEKKKLEARAADIFGGRPR